MPINYFTLLTINDKNLSPTTYTYLLVCYVEHTAICMCLIGCDYHLVYNFTNHYIFHEKHLLTLHEKYVDKREQQIISCLCVGTLLYLYIVCTCSRKIVEIRRSREETANNCSVLQEYIILDRLAYNIYLTKQMYLFNIFTFKCLLNETITLH